jgi:hypothetical protein
MNRNQQTFQAPTMKAKYYKFDNAKKRWTDEEDRQLIKRYRDDKEPLMQICEHHSRSPYAIMTRLIKLKCVDKPVDTFGFDEFTNTVLYNKEWVDKLTPEECANHVGDKDVIMKKIQSLYIQIRQLEEQLDF